MTTGNKRKHMTLGSIAGVMALALNWSPALQAQQAAGSPIAIQDPEAANIPLDADEVHSETIDVERELLEQAALYPQTLVGRTLRLESGEPVGDVLDVRRRLDNLFIYLVVDATDYFNTPTTYAIPVREVERLDGGDIVMSYNDGMHVAGMTYRPEEYTAVKDNFPDEALPTEAH